MATVDLAPAASSAFRRLLSKISARDFAVSCAAALALAAIGNYYSCHDEPDCTPLYVHHWKLHHFLFNYWDLGFTKRALVGTLLDLPQDSTTSDISIRVFSLVILLIFTVLLIGLSFSIPRSVRILLIASPAVFLQAGFDFGRPDQLNYVLLLLILLSGASWAILLAPVLVLIHEGAFLIHLPLLFAAHGIIYGHTRSWAISVGLSVATVATLMTYGKLDPELDIPSIYPAVAFSYEIFSQSLLVNSAGVFKNLSFVGYTYTITVLLMLSYLAFILIRLKCLLPQQNFFGIPVYLVTFSPLFVAIFGTDWGRWPSYAAMNLFILASIYQYYSNNQATTYANRRFIDAILLCAVFLGPFGVFAPLPLIHSIKALLLE